MEILLKHQFYMKQILVIFDVLKLKVKEYHGIALHTHTHQYDTKSIKLKKWVDPTPYLRVNYSKVMKSQS